MDKIVMEKITLKNNRIKYFYSVEGKIKKYFNFDNQFELEYYQSISGVPEEILIIPFIVNVLPIIWLTDSELYVKKIDYDFYKSIEQIKTGFKKMYPKVKFKGKVIALEKIKSKQNLSQSSIFFSGGVDSVSSLFTVLKSNPILITVWGSDVWNHDETGWEKLKDVVKDYQKKLKLNSFLINSNFRKFILESELNKDFEKKLQDTWWHGIQHGIGLIGHLAPYAYKYKIKTHYIPATYTEKDLNVKCASYPFIDEAVKFCGCHVIHEGFDKTRQEKVTNIIRNFDNLKITLPIRVCFIERGEKTNCCTCEKCYRTIMAIISLKKDPKSFGFDYNEQDLKKIPDYLRKNPETLKRSYSLWQEIQSSFKENKIYWLKKPNLRWILFFNFKKYY